VPKLLISLAADEVAKMTPHEGMNNLEKWFILSGSFVVEATM